LSSSKARALVSNNAPNIPIAHPLAMDRLVVTARGLPDGDTTTECLCYLAMARPV
jgi:hypothetical protein